MENLIIILAALAISCVVSLGYAITYGMNSADHEQPRKDCHGQ